MNRKDDALTTRVESPSDSRGALIVASRRWFREGLKGLLQALNIASQIDAATLDECVAALRAEDRPTIALVSLEGDEERLLRDFDTIRQWSEQLPETKWVVLSSNLKPAILLAALQSGVYGVFHVDTSEDVLRRAVELILLGQVLFPSELSRMLLGALRPATSEIPAAVPVRVADLPVPQPVERKPEQRVPLSPRERQILQCLVAGHPNKVIARELDIAEATVKVHIKGLLRKVKAANRTQAAIWAMNQRPDPAVRASNVVQLPLAALAAMGAPVTEPRTAAVSAVSRNGFAGGAGLAVGAD